MPASRCDDAVFSVRQPVPDCDTTGRVSRDAALCTSSDSAFSQSEPGESPLQTQTEHGAAN